MPRYKFTDPAFVRSTVVSFLVTAGAMVESRACPRLAIKGRESLMDYLGRLALHSSERELVEAIRALLSVRFQLMEEAERLHDQGQHDAADQIMDVALEIYPRDGLESPDSLPDFVGYGLLPSDQTALVIVGETISDIHV